MDDSLITLTGKFTYILFRNEGNFYTAAKFEVNDEKGRVISIRCKLSWYWKKDSRTNRGCFGRRLFNFNT